MRLVVIICIYHEVSPQECLKEAALSTSDVPKNIAAEHAALGLLLLQVNLLVSGHCRVYTEIHHSTDILHSLSIKLTNHTRALTITPFVFFI